jgi:hypothetical protein
MKLLFSLLVLLFASVSQAAVLKLDCVFSDPEIRDHILIELSTEQRGTFYYQAEMDNTTSATPTDKLEIRRVASDRAEFAKWKVNRDEVGLFFLMPAGLVSKPSESFDAELLTQIAELHLSRTQDMKCLSRY